MSSKGYIPDGNPYYWLDVLVDEVVQQLTPKELEEALKNKRLPYMKTASGRRPTKPREK